MCPLTGGMTYGRIIVTCHSRGCTVWVYLRAFNDADPYKLQNYSKGLVKEPASSAQRENHFPKAFLLQE